MLEEVFFVRSVLFGAAEVLIAVAYLACMFVVVAFRPQQIVKPGLFRLSYILFALYFVVPSSINALVSLSRLDGTWGGAGAVMVVSHVVSHVSELVKKVLLGLSIVFALASISRCLAAEHPVSMRP